MKFSRRQRRQRASAFFWLTVFIGATVVVLLGAVWAQ